MNKISAIIPVLNEAEIISDCLKPLANSPDCSEVIVVDGGSTDGTSDRVREMPGVRLIATRAGSGRATQMNAGAGVATGDVFLFLHADTRLPDDAFRLILRSLEDHRVVGGRFRLRIAGEGAIYAWIGIISTWRSRFLNITYGDQAVFVRRGVFDRLGGFPILPILEDSEFCLRATRIGRFVMLPAYAVTSSRRWERCGIFRTILLMWLLKVLHSLSISPDRISRLYPNVR